MIKAKPKKCAICKSEFTPNNSMIKHCSPECGYKIHTQTVAKKHKKEKIAYLKANTSTTTHKMRAQTAINSYVRLKYYHDPCYTCGKKPAYTQFEFDAGHFVPVGNGLKGNSLRFNLKNIRKQCLYCNRNDGLGGNYIEYRKRLVSDHGLEYVEYLENYNEIKPMGKYYFERIQKIFNKKARLQKKRLGID